MLFLRELQVYLSLDPRGATIISYLGYYDTLAIPFEIQSCWKFRGAWRILAVYRIWICRVEGHGLLDCYHFWDFLHVGGLISDLGTIETKNPIQHPDVKMKHAIVVFSHFKTQPKIALRCHTRHIRIGKIDSKQPEWFRMIQGSWGDLDIIQSIQWGLKGRWADGCNKSQTSAGSPSPVELVPWLVHPGGVSWCLESALDFGVILEGKW